MELVQLDKRDKLTVCFNMAGHSFPIFSVIQMGANGIVDLKITDFYNEVALYVNANSTTEEGFLKDSDHSIFIKHLEISYHQDGTFLWKNCDLPKFQHRNPYGNGERWIPTSNIKDFLPLFSIQIRRMKAYTKYYKEMPKDKGHKKYYICQCDELFDFDGTYYLVLMIVNKNMPFCCIGNSSNFSDKIASLNDKFYLCLLIQRYEYPLPQPYYSSKAKAIITPYANNIISPPNRETCQQELLNKLGDSLFDPVFASYLLILNGGDYFYMSSNKKKILEDIDEFWKEKVGRNLILKALFTKFVLFDNLHITSFNKKSPKEKYDYFLLKYDEMIHIPSIKQIMSILLE